LEGIVWKKERKSNPKYLRIQGVFTLRSSEFLELRFVGLAGIDSSRFAEDFLASDNRFGRTEIVPVLVERSALQRRTVFPVGVGKADPETGVSHGRIKYSSDTERSEIRILFRDRREPFFDIACESGTSGAFLEEYHACRSGRFKLGDLFFKIVDFLFRRIVPVNRTGSEKKRNEQYGEEYFFHTKREKKYFRM